MTTKTELCPKITKLEDCEKEKCKHWDSLLGCCCPARMLGCCPLSKKGG